MSSVDPCVSSVCLHVHPSVFLSVGCYWQNRARIKVIKSSRKAVERRNGSAEARPEPLKHSSHCSEAL